MTSLALLTDLYELTMVYGYWRENMAARKAAFHLSFRRWPFHGGFALAAGLETWARMVEDFRFTDSDLAYLESLTGPTGKPFFLGKFLSFLQNFRFACDVDALPEGTLVFPHEPLIRVVGPIWQAQLLESITLNLLNFQTLIATKAARVCLAAFPDRVVEFGMRRAQGVDGAISASRAAFIGGCHATSNVLAGKLFGIPVQGTHAHSWVMAFDQEEESFTAFAKAFPQGSVFLVDTYDSIEGARRAIRVAKRLGMPLEGVRLDSGDLAHLSIEIRKLLDQEGFSRAKIMASNELDEHLILDLKQQGARITLWGVGTHLVTGKDQPALDGIYKLSAIQDDKGTWIHKLKLSETTAKVTNPGLLQVRRFFDGNFYVADGIYDELTEIHEPFTSVEIQDPACHQRLANVSSRDLLTAIFRQGKRVYDLPSLVAVQTHAKEELSRLPPSMKRFTNPQPYPVGLERGLYQKKLDLVRQLTS